MSLIQFLWKLRQENHKFEGNLEYTVNPCLPKWRRPGDEGTHPDRDSDQRNSEGQSVEVPQVPALCFTLPTKKFTSRGEEQMTLTPQGKTAMQFKWKTKSTTHIFLKREHAGDSPRMWDWEKNEDGMQVLRTISTSLDSPAHPNSWSLLRQKH